MKINKNLKEANNLIQLKLTKMEKEKNAIQQKYEKKMKKIRKLRI